MLYATISLEEHDTKQDGHSLYRFFSTIHAILRSPSCGEIIQEQVLQASCAASLYGRRPHQCGNRQFYQLLECQMIDLVAKSTVRDWRTLPLNERRNAASGLL
jgi:hypothetical protein